ncbi:hypothetical protein C497_00965 [Halalkalicoccus jeotgali B3]|uniref:Uncharacterized protein n=1 Tax=Halalkalicoccus jeotgali (strain DSM 18796 / CECT 7217 / JCM 14584 / KCTC 4019 / B3) TaxID=795797 RepID=D8JBF9_HALJB|nr:hypothetical protein HacjB3_16281 [Halalkalicoccus jeotgali B3]ELY41291.1 hypothetical protein C497_00965 [Halalkalicoccus jeotgali B3]
MICDDRPNFFLNEFSSFISNRPLFLTQILFKLNEIYHT